MNRIRSPYFWLLMFALVPFITVGAYVTAMNVVHVFRYDEQYFTDAYLEKYPAPGPVSIAIEQAIQKGEIELMQEISGLRKDVHPVEPNSDFILTTLLDVDDFGYFHYLYLDMSTLRRSTYYVKEVSGRYVFVPQDAYFYYDSGYWWDVYLPIALVWWVIVAACTVGVIVHRYGARTRREMRGG